MSQDELQVKLVRLEPLRMACVNGYGQEPERLAFDKMKAYVEAKAFDKDGQVHRFFGYNNPDPTSGSPNYGYDVWVTVDESVRSGGEAKVFTFPGGLYAVTRIQPATGEEIYETWQKLVAWRECSPYRAAHHQWLEEHIGDLGAGFPDIVMDLYMPVAE